MTDLYNIVSKHALDERRAMPWAHFCKQPTKTHDVFHGIGGLPCRRGSRDDDDDDRCSERLASTVLQAASERWASLEGLQGAAHWCAPFLLLQRRANAISN